VTDNSRKTPIVVALRAGAAQRAADVAWVGGKGLPCKVTAVNGQIVTVTFLLNSIYTPAPVTMPIATSAYDWVPVQVGDLGRAMPIDAYLGGVSGLGGGTADLTPRGNLTTLTFHPTSNSAWMPPGGDGNLRITQGPHGVRLQDTGGNTVLVVDNAGHVTITGDLRVSGEVTAGYGGSDSVTLQQHVHPEIMTGSADSPPPKPGT
jgi:hypothetical protein